MSIDINYGLLGPRSLTVHETILNLDLLSFEYFSDQMNESSVEQKISTERIFAINFSGLKLSAELSFRVHS